MIVFAIKRQSTRGALRPRGVDLDRAPANSGRITSPDMENTTVKTNILLTTAMTLGLTASAFAQAPKATPATPATPATKAGAAMPATPAQPAAKDAMPAKMELPKPPPEIAVMMKTMAGAWKCVGKAAMDPMDTTKMADVKLTVTFKADYDKWWIRGEQVGKIGGMTVKGTMFTTYDALKKQWVRVSIDNMGGSETAYSSGAKDNKLVWEGEARGMMSGKTRFTEDTSVPKQVALKGEMTMDGKTWMTGFEAVCKK